MPEIHNSLSSRCLCCSGSGGWTSFLCSLYSWNCFHE